MPAAAGSAGNAHQEHCTIPSPLGISACSELEQASCAEICRWPIGLPRRPLPSSDSGGSDSPAGGAQRAGAKQGTRSSPPAWGWLGALPGDAQRARAERGRGSSGGNGCCGKERLCWVRAEVFGSVPFVCLRRWLQGHVHRRIYHTEGRDAERKWARGSGCRGASKPLLILGCLPCTGVLVCLGFLG